MHLGDDRWLAALWALPLAALLAAWGWQRRRTLLRRLAEARLLEALAATASPARLAVKTLLALAALGAVVFSLARPQWNARPQEVRRLGRDVCFVIDVSRSMLAADLAPSRLERSKMWVRDALAAMRGDRVAIVAFAGSAVVKCPLTHDYGFARLALEELSPGSVLRGGTYIGDAIRLAAREVFDADEASHKDLILITDGEDMESFPVEAATAAGEAGIRIIAIGIGDESVGTPIRLPDEFGRELYVMHDGERVLSRLDAQTLRQVALASRDGQYLNVATGTIELDDIYERLIRRAPQREMEATEAVRYEEKFQIFLGLGLALLVMEGLISERKRTMD